MLKAGKLRLMSILNNLQHCTLLNALHTSKMYKIQNFDFKYSKPWSLSTP